LPQAADVAKGAEPNLLEHVRRVVLVIDQSAEKVVKAVVPTGDKLVPRGQIATTAAENE